MSYKVEAVVTDIFPTDKITDRFSKRVIWIKTEEQYPQVWEVQFANQNIDLLDNINVNDKVEIQFGIQGKKSDKNGNERIFNSINGFGIRKL